MAHSLPGGHMFSGFGGYISATNKGGAAVRIDVAEWTVERKFINTECTHSGCLGAITRRRTGLDWNAKLTIWYDGANNADVQLESGWSVALTLYVGSADAWVGYGYTDQGRYVSPSGLVATIKIIDSSDGNSVVRQEITIDGNSLMFHLPDEQTDYNEYMVSINALGWTT